MAEQSGEPTCSNCGDPHDADDVFCESCGFDFVTGSLPDDESPAIPTPAGAPVASARFAAEVSVDPDYFGAVVTGGELDLPDPIPAARTVEIFSAEAHIGRTSASRNIHPDLDVAELTGDPAVSSRHAVIKRAPDGTFTITDVGSTNGTTVGAIDSELLKENIAIPVAPGTPIYVGAWTRLRLVVGGEPAAGAGSVAEGEGKDGS